MDKNKTKELIQHIYSSLRSLDLSNSWIRPHNYSSCLFVNPVKKEEKRIQKENINFEFSILKKEMKFRFEVSISKMTKERFYQKDRYITRVKIKTNETYSSDEETYYFDSLTEVANGYPSSLDTQKNIFDYLMGLHNKNTFDSENAKIESYISDIKKFDVAAMRDNKINDIIN